MEVSQQQVQPHANALDSRSLIDAEIERIRKRCDIQYHVNVDKVVVKG